MFKEKKAINWLSRNYPIGKEMESIHPYTNETKKCVVVNHYTDQVNNDWGIVIKFTHDGITSQTSKSFLD